MEIRREMPADFAALAPTMTKYELERHYRASYKTVSRWLKAAGLTARAPIASNAQPVPSDFAEMCKRFTVTGLRNYYGGGESKIHRWLSVSGLKACPRGTVPSAKRKPNQTSFKPNQTPVHIIRQDNRIRSIYTDAADALRRERWIVYRCTEKGAADVEGRFWRVGNVVLTPDELLARAERYRQRAA